MLRAADTIQMTDTGRQRRDNEDSMFARAPVFVVADGMGGAQAGEVASQIAVEAFEQGLPDSGSPEERLASCVREANRRIHEISRSERERAGMGTTLTAAYLDEGQLAIAHVGDSRAYLFRDGALMRLTEDHSLVHELVKRGKLTEEQAEEHPQRSIITRALGPEPSVEVDTWTYAVRDGDVLLLCSDGLTSMISEDKIAAVLAAAASLEQAADHLIAEANGAGGRDNITVVLTRIEDVGDGDGVEAPTMVGARSPGSTTRAASATSAAGGKGGSAGGAATPREPLSLPDTQAPKPRGRSGTRSALATSDTAAEARAKARVPLARTQGRPARAQPRRRPRRFVKPLAALTSLVIVLCLIGGGGYLATRQLYFISTNANGVVTIYRGLPYTLPAGVPLFETFYVSGVPAALVPASRRPTLFNDDLRSQADAESVVRDLELGQLSR